jgi:hypothetical protein
VGSRWMGGLTWPWHRIGLVHDEDIVPYHSCIHAQKGNESVRLCACRHSRLVSTAGLPVARTVGSGLLATVKCFLFKAETVTAWSRLSDIAPIT